MINKKQTLKSNMVSSVAALIWASAILASASVMVLCVTAQVSATVIQAIILLTIVLSAYRSFSALLTPVERYEAPKEERPPMDTSLRHYLDVEDNAATAYKNDGSSDLPFKRVEKSIRGPASHECGVFGDFVMFCTVSGTYVDGSIVDISALDSDGDLMGVGMDFITTGGIGYVSGTIGDAEVIVKRPDGVDTMSYVLTRQAQTLSLRVVNPLQDENVKDTKPCEVIVTPLVNKEMVLNRDDVSMGKFVNFGVYESTFTAEQHLELDMFLKRVCLLRSPIVTGMNKRLSEATDALTTAKKENPFGSEKVGEKCATSIPDWRSPDYSAAAEDCKREIASHCTIHPESPGCECWNTKSERYTTNTCVSYRNLFSGKSAIDLKNLDAESLSTIKSHYNLFESAPVAQTTKKPTSFTDKQWYDYILGTKS